MLMRLWRSFWDWFTEPMPFPRDHWYRREVLVIWEEYFAADADAPETEAIFLQLHHEVDTRQPS